MQSDPLGFAAGNLNIYAYTWNDPANWTDPSGLQPSVENAIITRAVVRMAREAVKDGLKQTTLCLANSAATTLGAYAKNYATNPMLSEQVFERVSECVIEAETSCGCGSGGGGRRSFVEGIQILTPDGPVAIEDLREGDLVVARDEETGQSGEVHVTALMSRTADGVLWLDLADSSGRIERLGVTAEHPLFAKGLGWIEAGDLAVGDRVRNGDFAVLEVVSVELDATPRGGPQSGGRRRRDLYGWRPRRLGA